MRAAAAAEFGPPEVLRIVEVADPQPGPGEVRVRIRAAGVQPADCAVRRGWQLPGTPATLPFIPGQEFAGIVDRIGEGVDGLTVGSAVLGFRNFDSYAEYTAVPASQVVPKPAEMPWDVAGGFPGCALTADTALEALGVRPLRSDRTVSRLAALVDLYRRGDLRVTISRNFPLEAAAEAHRLVETRHVRGKVVLIVE